MLSLNLFITICPSLDIWWDFIDTFAFWAITRGAKGLQAALHLSKLMLRLCARIFQISVILRKFWRNENVHQPVLHVHQITRSTTAQNYIFTNDASSLSADWNNAYESQLRIFIFQVTTPKFHDFQIQKRSEPDQMVPR